MTENQNHPNPNPALPQAVEPIAIESIQLDGGTQIRAAIDAAAVTEYAEAMDDAEAKFPPVLIFYDGSEYWLADGFHRLAAAKRLEWAEIEAEVRPGTRRDAILYSVGANASHGLQRTIADKRRAVETLLRDKEWGQWSDREISRQCKVGNRFVGEVRRSICVRDTDELSDENPQKEQRKFNRNGAIYTQKVSARKRTSVAKHTGNNLTHSTPGGVNNRPGASPGRTITTSVEDDQGDGESKSTDEQYTPRKIIDAVLECFGRIALDPCSNSHTNPNVPADRHFTKKDNGLDQDWEEDNAYINPPYSDKEPWIVKTVEEYTSKRLPEAITLTPTDTSTYWFELIWEHASAVCFVNRRLKFINPANKSPARFASAIAYFGLDVQAFYKAFNGKIGRCAMPMFENAPTEAQWKASEEKRIELLEALRENLSEIQQLKNERDQAINEIEALRQKQLDSQEMIDAVPDNETETDPEQLNLPQLAYHLGVTHAKIRQWEENGQLKDKGWEPVPGTSRPRLYCEIGA